MSSEEQSRLEITLEDMNGKFDLLLEGHTSLENMVTDHRAETRQDKQELLSLIKTVHDSLDAKIDGVEQRLDAKIDGVRDELKEDIHAVGEKVEGHEDRIAQLEKKAA